MLTIVKLTRTLYKLFNEHRRFNLLFKGIDIHLESQIDVLQTQGKNSNQSVRLTVLISCFSLVFGLLFLGSNHQSGYFSTNMAHLLLVFLYKINHGYVSWWPARCTIALSWVTLKAWSAKILWAPKTNHKLSYSWHVDKIRIVIVFDWKRNLNQGPRIK